ncbi:MAG: glycosyltransferase family 39 protein, partial [Cyclobacteriaceae bacterium]
NNPLFFEFILHFWTKIVGISAFSVRFLPVLFSALTGVVLFEFARKNHSFLVGVGAALLFTFSDAIILYSHTARTYSMLLLFTSLAMYFLVEVLRTHSKKRLIFFTIFNALVIYTHYISPFILFAEFIIVVLSVKEKKKYYQLILSALSSCFLASPIIYFFILRVTGAVSQGTWVQKPSGLESIHFMLWKFFNTPLASILTLVIIIAAIVVYLVRIETKQTLSVSVFGKVTIVWSAMLVFIFCVSFHTPLFMRRYVLFTVPALCLLVPYCLSFLFTNIRLKIGVVVLFAGVVTFTASLNKDNDRNLREMVSYVKKVRATLDKSNVMLFSPAFDDLGIAYYYSPTTFKSADKKKLKSFFKSERMFPLLSISQRPEEELATAKTILFLDGNSNFSHPNNGILTFLKKHYRVVSKKHFHEVHDVWLFEK